MKKKITAALAIIVLAAIALNAAMYFMNSGSVNLTKNECSSMKNKNDEIRVIGGNIASKFGGPPYKYAFTYFVVGQNMKMFWTRQMIVSLSNCPDDLHSVA